MLHCLSNVLLNPLLDGSDNLWFTKACNPGVSIFVAMPPHLTLCNSCTHYHMKPEVAVQHQQCCHQACHCLCLLKYCLTHGSSGNKKVQSAFGLSVCLCVYRLPVCLLPTAECGSGEYHARGAITASEGSSQGSCRSLDPCSRAGQWRDGCA